MTEFDPEKFEDKYVHYFEELEAAYSNAYQQLHGQYDSTVLKAIDRQVLSESEPFYVGDESTADSIDTQSESTNDSPFRLELPDDPGARVGTVADHDRFDIVLEELVDQIERELARQFDLESER
ncbi:hypothetical protein D8Y22_13245 [Salinadaptatus halalkaliphilus]|uniref:Uncharacterized protein n=1 Tax=Salinadaptatus halalkaliphilus TaxID=2419781 RepID=A0A4S3TM83_9EURY|nr:DUF5783 family protein [Salinadaptatus halalkaliphilus]THE64373.1 hypothetical protein D8Y22_13245 [Salinadaptatus halalkaliphilus]